MPDRKPRTSDGGPRNRTEGKPDRDRSDRSSGTGDVTYADVADGEAITVTDTLKPERPTRPERPPKGKDE